MFGLCGMGLVAGVLEKWLCEKRPKDVRVSDSDFSSWLQKGPAAAQS